MVGRFEEADSEPLPEGAEPPSRWVNPDAFLALKPHVPSVRFDTMSAAVREHTDPLRGPGAYDPAGLGEFGPAPPLLDGGGASEPPPLPAEWQPFGLTTGRPLGGAARGAEGDRLELDPNLDAVRPAPRYGGQRAAAKAFSENRFAPSCLCASDATTTIQRMCFIVLRAEPWYHPPLHCTQFNPVESNPIQSNPIQSTQGGDNPPRAARRHLPARTDGPLARRIAVRGRTGGRHRPPAGAHGAGLRPDASAG